MTSLSFFLSESPLLLWTAKRSCCTACRRQTAGCSECGCTGCEKSECERAAPLPRIQEVPTTACGLGRPLSTFLENSLRKSPCTSAAVLTEGVTLLTPPFQQNLRDKAKPFCKAQSIRVYNFACLKRTDGRWNFTRWKAKSIYNLSSQSHRRTSIRTLPACTAVIKSRDVFPRLFQTQEPQIIQRSPREGRVIAPNNSEPWMVAFSLGCWITGNSPCMKSPKTYGGYTGLLPSPMLLKVSQNWLLG